jgi:histidinol dehydrogenase
MEEFASAEEQEEIIRATAVLARLEGLEGHARSALARLESGERGISHGA